MRTIGRNTLGVRLIKLDEGDTVSSLAKLPEDELSDGAELETISPDGQPGDLRRRNWQGPVRRAHHPHIIDDGVGEAEASDHIDLNGEDDDTPDQDDEPSV